MLLMSSSSSVDAVDFFLEGVFIFPPPECDEGVGDPGDIIDCIGNGEYADG